MFRFTCAAALLCASLAGSVSAAEQGTGRERILFDSGWRFALGHASDPQQDFGHGTGHFSYLAKTGYGDGPAQASFDDRAWRTVELPHDWAVEAPFDPRASTSHGFKAVGRGFPQRSIGWYRRSFVVPQTDLGRRIEIEFDGIYRDARVFINGFLVGEHASGYSGVRYDLTDYLKYGEENVIAVRVDASMEEGWYYEGAGIYRHVWLLKLPAVHVARHGTWVRTRMAGSDAVVKVDTTVRNRGRESAEITIEQMVLAPDGRQVANSRSTAMAIEAGAELTRSDELQLQAPQLWSLETPALHTLVTTVRQDSRVIDRYETPFGVRTVRFDPEAGFLLNERRVVLKGTNNHQDHAGVGVALPDALQTYRLQRLKEMGSNAYRASHHPPTPELLDAADRLGMLVIDENRLMGSNELHLKEVEEMIRRDRNHPSVILWSIGNEEWGIEGNVTGTRIATTLQDFVRRLDPTRAVTAALSGLGGTSKVIEVAGINYIKNANPDGLHREHPWQVIVGTEETTTRATRGIYVDDRAHAHLAPIEDGPTGGNAESAWRYYAMRPYAAGVFFWTGFDYRGEPTPFGFPAIGSQSGILDSCGLPKDSFHYLKAWWSDEPVLHIFPHWNWPDRVGEDIEVRAHTNLEEVELVVNGVSLGRKPVERNAHVAWHAKYAPGELVAHGYRGGRRVMTVHRATTGAPTTVHLASDRPTIAADGRDVAVFTVEVRDSKGRVVPTAGELIRFTVAGPGRIIGVGNGDPSSHEPDTFVPIVQRLGLGRLNVSDVAAEQSTITFEATFDRPAGSGLELALLLEALGRTQSAYLNGQALYVDAAASAARAAVPLDANALRDQGNRLRIEAQPFEQPAQRHDALRLEPAALRILTAAPQPQRRTFNGFAQVIVQSTGERGTIRITASSGELRSGSHVVTAR
jgi:beta-galactosidase